MIASIVGIPAVGKTTTIDLLKEASQQFTILKEDYPNSITDPLQQIYSANTPTMRHDIQTVFFEHDRRKTRKIEELQKRTGLVVLDRGLEDTWLVTDFYAEQGLLDKNFFYDRYYRAISPFFSDLVVYLTADMDEVSRRSRHRDGLSNGPKRSKADTFVSDLFVRSNYYYVWHHANNNCVDIDSTALSPDAVAGEVMQVLLAARTAKVARNIANEIDRTQ